MTKLAIQLLSSFAVTLDDQPITKFRSAKSRALLAYLATQPDVDHVRTTLATLFWGNLPEAAAKTNLRIELSNLNKLLEEHPALVIERNSVRFQRALATVDVVEFRETLNSILALTGESQTAQLARLQQVLDQYPAGFLSGFQLEDALEFEEWQLLTQEQLHELTMRALTTLQQRYAAQGSWPELAAAARRQLALVPWHEAAHRNLIQALAAQGQRTAALEQYDRCVAVLHEELGVEPALATQEIVARLRTNAPETMRNKRSQVRHNLVQQQKSLVGRNAEIEQLHTLLLEERLVILVGLGGVGKSRLAQAVAQQALPDFADGVWFVSLTTIEADATAADRVALAIAAAMDFAITDTLEPWTELTRHLAQREVLLVLDNWEQLVGAAEEVFDHLLGKTSVNVLATSRVRLMVEGEQIVTLSGLAEADAYTLFVDRARRTVPGFVGEPHTDDIAQICRSVGGLPLGIELAASWVEHIPVAEMGRSLMDMAVAPSQATNLTDRHHLLSRVFEYSWQLLSPQQQQILARLSAFRGGFDRAAANAIAQSDLSDLSMLIAHSLVQRLAAGRYDLHPLVQEFAASKVMANEMSQLLGAHSRYYLTALTEQALPSLLLEFSNLRFAWQRAIELTESADVVAALKQSVLLFGKFMLQFGTMADGHMLFQNAANYFETVPEQREVLAQLLEQQSLFVVSVHGPPAAIPIAQRTLNLSQDPQLRFRMHVDLGNYYAELGQWEAADAHFDQSEQLAETSGDLALYISAVEARVHINAVHFRGDFARAIQRLEEALSLLDGANPALADSDELYMRLYQSLVLPAIRHRDYATALHYTQRALALVEQQNDRRRRCYVLRDLALAEQFAGIYEAAIAHLQEALTLAEEIGDTNEMGLLNANHCLTLRQTGALDAALDYGRKAIAILGSMKQPRIEGQARNRIGHTLLELGRWVEAEAAYCEALRVWEPLHHPNRYEAGAGRAVALYQLGRQAEALASVDEVLEFVESAGLVGIVEPVLLLLNCEMVLAGNGVAERAAQALNVAQQWVQTVVNRNKDASVRMAFLARPNNLQLAQRRIRYQNKVE